jgi:hypothetical protein
VLDAHRPGFDEPAEGGNRISAVADLGGCRPRVPVLGAAINVPRINLVGSIEPVAVGWAKDVIPSFAGGLYFIAVVTAIVAVLVIANPRHVAAPGAAA